MRGSFIKKNSDEVDYNALKKAFWAFSKRLYAISELEDAWICLEQKYELNLNLVFLCCFLPTCDFQQLTKEDLRFVSERILLWHTKVVEPLRKLYQRLYQLHRKPPLFQLADLALRNEILAEQAEQSLMLQVIYRLKDRERLSVSPANRILSNIFEYINESQVKLHSNDFEKIYRIVNQCF